MKKYIVKQEDEADCGPCSLLSVIKYYKGYVPLEVIKIDTITTEYGTNFFNIKTASIKYGFNTSGKKVKEIKNIILPCIAQVKINGYDHFVTVYKVEDEVTYMDPAHGFKNISHSKFNEIFTGNILELIPAGKIIRYEKNNLFKEVLINIYKEHIKDIVIILILSLTVVIIALINGFNAVMLKNIKLVPLVITLTIIKIIINYLKNNIVSHLNKKINVSLLNNYLKQIFNLPLKYLQFKKTGDFINRINDLDTIKEIYSKTIVEALINFLLCLGSIILLLIFSFRLTLIIILFSLIYIFLLIKLNKKIYYKIILAIENKNILTDKIIEYLNKITTIKINKSSYFNGNLNVLVNNLNENNLELDKTINTFHLISHSLEDFIMIIILMYFFYKKNDVTNILLFITVFSYYLESIKYYINLLPLLKYFKDVIYRIKSIYDIEGDKSKFKYSKDITIKNLTYDHNHMNNIFNKFNMKIKYGSKVLIKGENGTGKSTLLNIIFGNINDYEGTVYRNKNISYVNQNSDIFSDTILKNIILDKDLNENKLSKIIKILLLDDFISTKGLSFNVTNLTNLSGGEIQKIILARTLYNDFDALLIDEALNQIAKKDRDKILSNIFKYYNKKTIVYISHYEEEVKFDQIINLTVRKGKYVN